MDSKRLSERLRQPGHDRTFLASEHNFCTALRKILPNDEYRVEDCPTDLKGILGGRHGVRPEASIEYLAKGRKMYFEVKKQGDRGNAEERACKHHTVQFYKTLRDHTGYDYHAFSTILCESLATLDRYTIKHRYYFEPDHYFLWVGYKLEPLADYLDRLRAKYLEVDCVASQVLPR